MTRRPERRSKWLLCVLTLALGASVAAPSMAASQDTIQRVRLDLGGGALTSPVPFDEPFLLFGPAPAELRSVSARVLEEQPGKSVSCKPVVPDGASRHAWFRRQTLPHDTFYVPVDSLLPNRRYTFCITAASRFTDAQLDTLRRKARAALDGELRALNGLTSRNAPQGTDSAAIARFRVRLIQLLGLGADQVLVVPPGSLLDTTRAVSEANPFLAFGALKASQDERLGPTIQFESSVAAVADSLKALASDSALAALLLRVDPSKPAPPFGGTDLPAAVATARTLQILPPRRADFVAGGGLPLRSGNPAPAVFPPLSGVWDAAAVRARAAMLDQTAQDLATLGSLAATLARSPAQLKALQISSPASARLVAHLDNLAGLFASQRNALGMLSAALDQRDAAIDEAVSRISADARENASIAGTSIVDFATRAKQTITNDIGFAYAPRLRQVFPYFGANFYCGAINKRVPLRYADAACKRLALTVGVNVQPLARPGRRDDLFSSFSLLLGGGLRVTDAIRIGGGIVLYRALSPNPLVDSPRLAATPFTSLSLDFDARAALGAITTLIFNRS